MELPEPWVGSTRRPRRSAGAAAAGAAAAGAPADLPAPHPIQTHSVKPRPAPPPRGVRDSFPSQARILSTRLLLHPEMGSNRRVHTLMITPQDKVLFNGREVGFESLRMHLDLISVSEGEWVDFRPEPNARYEMFIEILAVAKRARIERLRLDSRPFRRPMDEE